MTEESDALYWTPRGGNNADDTWGSCHTFVSVETNRETGIQEKDTIIVDLGRHERPYKFQNGKYERVLPALNDCLPVKGFPVPDSKDSAKAIFLTHGHSDHISGIFAYMKAGVKLPPIYASEYTLNMVKKGCIENGLTEDLLELHPVKAGETIQIGHLKIRSMQASHSIPGALSFKISNSSHSVFHTGDTKGDESSFLKGGVNFKDYERIAQEGPVDLMTFDSTTAAKPGHAIYESEIYDTFNKLIHENKGKQIIIPLAAAHCERIATVVAAARSNGKTVVLNGGANMDSNIVGMSMSGYFLDAIGAKNPAVKTMDPKNTVTITTGIYLEPDSPFVAYLKGQDNGFIAQKDAVILAPLTTDKNEKMMSLLLDSPRSKGFTLFTAHDYPTMYGSGHAQCDDFLHIAKILAPHCVAPIHASSELADDFNKMAQKNGYKTLNRQVRNGETVKIDAKGAEIVNTKKPVWYGLTCDKNNKFHFECFADDIFAKRFGRDRQDAIMQERSFKAKERIIAYQLSKRIRNKPLNSGIIQKIGRGR